MHVNFLKRKAIGVCVVNKRIVFYIKARNATLRCKPNISGIIFKDAAYSFIA